MKQVLWPASELAALFDDPDFRADVTGVSIDTRTLASGELFIALAHIHRCVIAACDVSILTRS